MRRKVPIGLALVIITVVLVVVIGIFIWTTRPRVEPIGPIGGGYKPPPPEVIKELPPP